MAVIDFLLLICSITLFGIPAISKYYYGRHFGWYSKEMYRNKIQNFINLILPYLYAMTMAVQTASVYLTVGITVERYLAVCHPFRAREICTRGLGLSKTKISLRTAVLDKLRQQIFHQKRKMKTSAQKINLLIFL